MWMTSFAGCRGRAVDDLHQQNLKIDGRSVGLRGIYNQTLLRV